MKIQNEIMYNVYTSKYIQEDNFIFAYNDVNIKSGLMSGCAKKCAKSIQACLPHTYRQTGTRYKESTLH